LVNFELAWAEEVDGEGDVSLKAFLLEKEISTHLKTKMKKKKKKKQTKTKTCLNEQSWASST
jgi:hypothetical protein